MIPSIIHQIWLTSPLPERYQAWREKLIALHPGWDVRLWTADILPDFDRIMDRYDLRGYHPTVASDVFRVLVVLHYGGFYLDCDVEPAACLEPLREHSFVCCNNGSIQLIAGHELRINSGHGFGAKAGSPILAAFMDRCEAMRGTSENVLYRAGFLGLSEHLWKHRDDITMLTESEMIRYYRHHGKLEWMKPDSGYRTIFSPQPLKEPFKKARSWPAPEEMLRHNRGQNVGCCSKPSTYDLRSRL